MNTLFVALVCIFCCYSTALFNFKLGKTLRDTKTIKSELLTLSRQVNKGINESPADRLKIESLVEELEKSSVGKETLKDPKLNAVWLLEYSTSEGTIGKTGPQKVGPILQTVDATKNFFQNSDTIKLFGFLEIPRKAIAELTTVEPPQRANVRFVKFFVGPVPIPISGSAGAFLDVTYVDEDLRLSRGNKGNIFVLSKYSPL
eukprot:gene34221-41420_t